MPNKTLLLILALISSIASAEVGWRDGNGNPVPDTDTQKSVAGFGGLLIVTPDEDWEQKWNSTELPPYFSDASVVARGGKLFILTIYTHPQVDDSGNAHVTMDIDITRPDGASSMHSEDAVCFQGAFSGSPHNVYLCGPVVGFVGEASDPAGTWSVQIALTDENRKASMSLATHFKLQGAAICDGWPSGIEPDMRVTEAQLTPEAVTEAKEFLAKHGDKGADEFQHGRWNSKQTIKGFRLKQAAEKGGKPEIDSFCRWLTREGSWSD